VSRFLRSTGQRIEILRWYECGPEDTFMEFHDRFFALGFLRSLMSDPLNMVTLRSVLVDILQDTEDTSRLMDHEILEQLAGQIARGYVRLVLREGESLQTSGGGGSWSGSQETTEAGAASSETQTADREETDSEVTELTTETGPVTPTERSEPAREAAPQQPPEEEESLVPESASGSQAGVLAAAAESGAPFCEC
jgi:hypothetical protein